MSRGPELLADLVDKTATVLVQQGELPPERATELARALADMLRRDWGGQLIYFPKGLAIDISERDWQLYNEWDGSKPHLEQLAEKYNISIQWAYKIVKARRAAEEARRQHDLFSE